MTYSISICCYIVLVALTSCNRTTPKPEDRQLGERIMAIVRSTGADQVSMDTVVKEAWDHLYILHPYISDEQVSSLEKEINGLSSINLNMVMRTDRNSHLIFTKEGEVVAHTTLLRYPCCNVIAEGSGATSVEKSKAIFTVNRSSKDKDTLYTLSLKK